MQSREVQTNYYNLKKFSLLEKAFLFWVLLTTLFLFFSNYLYNILIINDVCLG